MDLLLVGHGLDHEVRAVAEVSIRAEKDRADADRQNVFVESLVAQKEADFNLIFAHRFVE